MKITVITGSPRKDGATFLLAEEFIRGAKEAGHDVFRFDAAFEKKHHALPVIVVRQTVQNCHHYKVERTNAWFKNFRRVTYARNGA